jgi:hypothetical protein
MTLVLRSLGKKQPSLLRQTWQWEMVSVHGDELAVAPGVLDRVGQVGCLPWFPSERLVFESPFFS